MKLRFHHSALFLVLLLLAASRTVRAGLSSTTTQGVSHLKSDNDFSLDKLMGLEICENEDEECLERRIASESHLDYIYTQHRKKP